MKLILFDCDGTLVDSAHVVHRCMCHAFQAHGFTPPQPDQTKSIIGLSLHDAMSHLIDHQPYGRLDEMVQDYKDHFFHIRTTEDQLEPLYDGISQLIDILAQKQEHILGIVTGKSRRGVDAILEGHRMQGLFTTIRTADDCPSKPHPAMVLESCDVVGISPQSTYVIGDTTFDMDMARNAGAEPIGVSWGYHSIAQLRGSGAIKVMKKPSELIDIID